jgi:uncharacterized protein DUF1833
MPRAVSSASLRSWMREETGEVFVELLTLSHESLPEPIRCCSNDVPLTSRAAEFLPYPFELFPPDDIQERPPRLRLVIDNVDPRIITALRPLQSPIGVAWEVVRAAEPDLVEIRFSNLLIREVQYDVLTISGELIPRDLRTEAFPRHLFTPSLFPGLF